MPSHHKYKIKFIGGHIDNILYCLTYYWNSSDWGNSVYRLLPLAWLDSQELVPWEKWGSTEVSIRNRETRKSFKDDSKSWACQSTVIIYLDLCVSTCHNTRYYNRVPWSSAMRSTNSFYTRLNHTLFGQYLILLILRHVTFRALLGWTVEKTILCFRKQRDVFSIFLVNL